MPTPRLIATGQQMLALGLAAFVTATLLMLLGAQADVRHADALAQSTLQARLCAAPPAGTRS